MANGKTSTARRREVRRNVPKPKPGFLRVLRRQEFVWAALFGLAFAAVAASSAINARERPNYRLGQLITEPIVTPFAFTAIDAEQTQLRKANAHKYTPAIYDHNDSFLTDLKRAFERLLALADIEEAADTEDVPTAYREQFKLTPDGLNKLRWYANEKRVENWEDLTREFLREIFKLVILTPKSVDDEKNVFDALQVQIKHPDPRRREKEADDVRHIGALIGVDEIDRIEREVNYLVRTGFPLELHPTIVALVMRKLQPTYLLNAEQTRRRREQAYEAEPPFEANYEADQLVIRAGTRLDESQINTLKQMHDAVLAQEASWDDRWISDLWLSRGGLFATFLLIFVGMWSYIVTYNERISRNPMRGLAITGLLLLCLLVAVGCSQLWPQHLFLTATLPALMAAIVLTIAYDQRFALAIGSILAVMIVVSLGGPIGFNLVLFAGVAVAVGQLRDVRSRSKLVWVGFWTGLAMAAATLLVGLGTRPLFVDGELQTVAVDALIALGSGLLAGLLAQGVLPAIEKLFKVTTAMTLRELNDASLPLLQRMAQEAPGTYQHSLRIADMAETAAEAIGADALACRVGAMYHDIGKINKPLYFIENQGGGPNKHNKLSPAMSLLIIVGHVKDGVEMAREYGLPGMIRHIIESHHGTTLVEYFYHAAKKQTEAEDKPGPSEFEFRYPGLKPVTKEAAIMLLADGVEAAARALPDPTPIRLEQLVNSIASKRLMDGQFSDSNLTLSELNKIEQAITKTLCAIYHSRIKYPTSEAESERDVARPKSA